MEFLKYLMIIAFIMQDQSLMAMKALEKKQIQVAEKRTTTDEPFQVAKKRPTTDQPFKTTIRQYTYAPRALLIYLDDSEMGKYFVSIALDEAIASQAGPIITSLRSLRLSMSDPIYSAAYSDALWIVKEINKNMALLIPVTYLESIGINPEEAKKSDSKTITQTELALGIKVNHMETKTFKDLPFPTDLSQVGTADYFLPTLYNPATKTSNIFCLRSDYTKYENALPLWSLYIAGHGQSAKDKKKIVGIKLDDFKQVLAFLETQINTRLLLYSSCYSAATNHEEIYKDAQSTVQKSYSFPIITLALTDAPVTAYPYGGKPYKFVQDTTVPTSEIINYKEAMRDVNSTYGADPRNSAQLKLPGTEWFSILSTDKTVAQIGSILAKHRENKPLDIVQFFNCDPRILLIYTQDIPFELIIKAKNLKTIVSMIPGDTVHTIKKITSSLPLNKTLDWFMSIGGLNSKKIFYIESLHTPDWKTINDVIICNAPDFTQQPVIYERFAFFMDEDALFLGEKESFFLVSDFERIDDSGIQSKSNPNTIYSKEMYKALLAEVKRPLPE